MGALTQHEIAALLETAGAHPRGKRHDCPKCGGVRTVTHTDEVFYCHKCEWKGNTFTLAKELGVYRRLPSAEYRELCRTRELAREAEEEKVRVRVRMARERAAREWSSLRLAPSDHPYLNRKAIPPLGARLDHDGKLVVPVYRIECGHEVLVSLERIAPDGDKRFEYCCQMRGGYCFLPVGPIPLHPPERGWVAEGFATAASVALAMGEAVCCVFTCGNLIPALEALTQRMPGTMFVLAADNDSGKPGNPGLTAAKATAHRFGLRAVWPTFLPGVEGTDFNDLALEIGIDRIREELQSILWS